MGGDVVGKFISKRNGMIPSETTTLGKLQTCPAKRGGEKKKRIKRVQLSSVLHPKDEERRRKSTADKFERKYGRNRKKQNKDSCLGNLV